MIEAWMIVVFGLFVALSWTIGYYMGKTAPRNGYGERLPEADDFVPKMIKGKAKKKKHKDESDEFWESVKTEQRKQDQYNEITETEAKL